MFETDHKYPWSFYHTVTIIALKLCGDLLISIVSIFDEELSDESLVTLSSFSYVSISSFIGTVCALFGFPSFNASYFHNENKTITVVYSLLSSILFLLFGCTYFLREYLSAVVILFAQCVIWFFFGITFSIYHSSTVTLATKYSNPNEHGKILSLISFSWSLSSLFYVLVSYLIDVHASLPFIIFGIFIGLLAMLIHFTFKFHNTTIIQNNNTIDLAHNISIWQNKHYQILLLASFIMSISSGANITVLSSPLFHDLFNMSITKVGWCTLFTFFGEFVANIYMIKYSDKGGYFVTG
eukprot:163809_1